MGDHRAADHRGCPVVVIRGNGPDFTILDDITLNSITEQGREQLLKWFKDTAPPRITENSSSAFVGLAPHKTPEA